MKVAPPPLVLIDSSTVEMLMSFGAVDAQGRYLHWDELRHRIPRDVSPQAAWSAVKFARMVIVKGLPMKAADGSSFRYAVTDRMQQRLHRIDRLCGPQLDPAAFGSTSTQREHYFVASLLMEEAITSAQLEGAATTRKVAKQMLETERPPRDEHERMIVNNYLLMKEVLNCKDEALSIELIRRLHSLATDGTTNPDVIPGMLREGDDVVVQGRDGEVVHQPPLAVDLPERLEALCQFANADQDGREASLFIHPCIKAVILHFMLAYEHPFADGNGRTARALFYWYMLKRGYWPFEYISISSLLHKAPIQYARAYLYSESDEFDLTYFIDYQIEIVERAMDAFLAYIERKRREFYELMQWLDTTGIQDQLNFRQGQLLRKALRHPGRGFTVKEVSKDFGVTENTARADLKKLAKLKMLAEVQEGKTTLFIARADIAEKLGLAARARISGDGTRN